MNVETYRGIITALAPVHSGSDIKMGNEKTLRTLQYNLPDGPVEVPVVSGNGIRGPLRRLIFQDLIERAGYEPKNAAGQVKLYHSLFSGGILEAVAEKDAGYIDLAMKRKLRAAIPPLALLGTAIKNQMLEGKVDVGYAIPRVKELMSFLQAGGPEITATLADIQQQTFNTRRDEMAQAAKEGGGASSQMLHTWWYIPPGTTFQHAFTLIDPSDVERACLGQMIALWKMRPRLGAKAGTGNAVVSLDYPEIDPTAYTTFVGETTDDIRELLGELEG